MRGRGMVSFGGGFVDRRFVSAIISVAIKTRSHQHVGQDPSWQKQTCLQFHARTRPGLPENRVACPDYGSSGGGSATVPLGATETLMAFEAVPSPRITTNSASVGPVNGNVGSCT